VKRLLIGALVAVAAVAAYAGSATGQGSGGTLGERAVGTFTFFIQDREAAPHGINPGLPRNKKRPVLADVSTGRAALLDASGKRIGVGHSFDVTTHAGPRSKKYRGGAVFVANQSADFGNGNILYFACVAEDSPTDNHCAVMGGTGSFAGARGSAVQDFQNVKETGKAPNRTALIPMRVTFIP
jgi:hypothetical protein